MKSTLPQPALSFGARFKAARLGAGLTQLGAAALLGVGKRSVEYWEKGEHLPASLMQEAIFLKLSEHEHKETKV